MELILIMYFTYCNIFRILSFPHVINIKYDILTFCSESSKSIVCCIFRKFYWSIIVLVSIVQQSESAVWLHIAPLVWISFPFRSPQITSRVP